MKIDDTTNFTNPHGLSDKNNHSTPSDVCRIASLAMKNKHLKEIVSRRYYECTVVSREMNINLLQWFNSNKLLNDNFIGIKTGTTPSAGPCLCGYF
jgi:D-alanyl-D-alanine carboxypeptidase